MKKSYPYNTLSDRVCAAPKCSARLKKRLVEEKPTVTKCFKCHVAAEERRGHYVLGR